MTDSELDDTHCDCIPKKTRIYEIVCPQAFFISALSKVFVNILSTLICCTLHIKYHIYGLRKVIN